MKRILICSISSWSSKSGSNTYSKLFERYEKSKIANLYIREDNPDSSTCNLYFRISENSIIKSIFNRSIKTGQKILLDQEKDKYDNSENITITKNRYQHFRKFRPYTLIILREILWKIGKWKTKELDDFLDDFKPEIVLFAMEGYIHFDRICRYIINRTGAKGIGYFWDDNFTYKNISWNPLRILYRLFQKNEIKKCVRCCKDFLAITNKTKKEAENTFGIHCHVITKPVKINNKTECGCKNISFPIKIVYTGNLIYGRFDTLLVLAETINKLNSKSKNPYFVVDVYSGTELSNKEQDLLKPYVIFKGFISQNKIPEIFQTADILLFIEAIKGRHSHDARLSFSTKICDYLEANKCILAIGPHDIAPIEYLRDEDAALVATNTKELNIILNEVIKNNNLLNQYAENTKKLVLKNHIGSIINEKLYKIINC